MHCPVSSPQLSSASFWLMLPLHRRTHRLRLGTVTHKPEVTAAPTIPWYLLQTSNPSDHWEGAGLGKQIN